MALHDAISCNVKKKKKKSYAWLTRISIETPDISLFTSQATMFKIADSGTFTAKLIILLA